MSDGDARVAETASLDTRPRTTDGTRSYVLAITPESSMVHDLPAVGTVVLGRGHDAEIRLDHPSVSRAHAHIVVADGEVRITDLESYNGTRVNGEVVNASRVVVTGDVITCGEVVLVVHAAPSASEAGELLADDAWRRRLTDELARATTFHRPLAVLAIVGAASAPELARALRTIDVLGRGGDGELLAILPEADPEAARALAEGIARAAPTARIGLAGCPYDAIDPATLVQIARAAARAAVPAHRIATAATTTQRKRLGDREVLLCDPATVRVYELLGRLAAVKLPVLLIGETGVGKENAAFALHYESPRRDKPFVALNCAALPEQLVESQLFGHDKGAFTGATAARAGLLESAEGGTVFLDELGELALPIQAKILRAIETQHVQRLGEHRERAIDVRFVAATHRVLETEVAEGRFRRDLFFRLGGAKVHLPPLRERRAEIPMLFRELLARECVQIGRAVPHATAQVMELLLAHRFDGNVRELQNICRFLAATVVDDRIEPGDLPPELVATRPAAPAKEVAVDPVVAEPVGERSLAAEIAALERRRMAEALAQTGGVKSRAAQLIGVPLRTFLVKIKQYDLA